MLGFLTTSDGEGCGPVVAWGLSSLLKGPSLQVASCLAQRHAHACVPEHAAGAPVPASGLPGPAPAASRALPPAVQGGLHGQEDCCASRAGAHMAFPAAQLPAAVAGMCPLQSGLAAGAPQHREHAGCNPGADSPAPHPGDRGWHTASLQPTRAPRKHALRVLDMTGLLDDGVEQDPGTMSMWDCTAAVARTCIAQQQGGTAEPGLAPVPVEVRVDLRVNRASYAFLREALRSSVGSPLRLCCRDLRAEDLPMRNTVALLQLLDAGCLRRVDLRFNNLGLRGLSVIIPHVARFQHLASLRLHYVHGDSRQPSVDGEDNFRYFLAQMGRFTCLRELSMGSSLLSGRLDQLLSTLQSPLESLELAFCALLPEDLRFLAQSPHAVRLKKLDLSGNDLSGSQLEPFQVLLQAAAATLLHLELTECQLADTQLLATLPVLTRCTSLRYLGLYGNPLSLAGLKELLRDSVVQAELRTVVHPFPVDCYEGLPWPPPASVLLEASINEEKFARVEAELHQLLLASGRAHVLWTTDIYGRLAADYFSL
ncbi:leucine-rich repeat-containing protein 14 isoform X4 [Canis lupus familiaris]|uniref:leucine-rich repeat-containing protein 14 isoform X4 n=2 Tax=Canis lupus familiaris TaxID=9615 RepID=UPI0003ADF91E|nr:leucine-rich repeat-containing protein 14 isoform X4 [Canis lupus familiaris]XP_038411801.1 leucine-rich repeat-containing protein 14 isoform X4 [Canis lupus familiaris]XP_038541328.1 leucine-rich repeat-containing protein 14 isoform X4 [Canis lupus familiaris]|eukprot:XP_013974226.1 leucine-rich repeat-containing protein 14 isoform X1 [Canis lupus familiaris]